MDRNDIDNGKAKASEDLRELIAFIKGRDWRPIEEASVDVLCWMLTTITLKNPEVVLIEEDMVQLSRSLIAYGYYLGYKAKEEEEEFKPEFTEI